MKVRSVMRADVPTIGSTLRVEDALTLLGERHDSVFVVNLTEHHFGFISRRALKERSDRATAEGASELAVSDLVVPAFTTSSDEQVETAIDLMRRHGTHQLVVVEGGELLGVITDEDASKAIQLLKGHKIFAGFSREAIAQLSRIASFRDLPAGSVLVAEGEEDPDLFVLDRGELTVHTRQAGPIAHVRPGEMIGELEIFGGQNVATVRAASDSRVLVIDRARFLVLLAGNASMAATFYSNISELMSQRLRTANRFLFLRGIARHRMLVVKVLAAAGFALLLFTVAFGVGSEYPSFCVNCHYMKPYYDSWALSKHCDVSCVECHYAYGFHGVLRGKVTGLAMVTRYVTRTYDPKPEAEVSDASCMRQGCHPGPLQTTMMTSVPGTRFTHAAHAGTGDLGTGLRCTSCHEHGRQQNHFSVASEVCYLCHFMNASVENPKTNCRSCHTFETRDALPARIDHVSMPSHISCTYCHEGVVTGDGSVEEFRCYSCHLDPPAATAPELHRIHTELRKVACFECHGRIQHEGGTGRILAQNCEACHRDQHAAQEQVYLGQGGRDVIDTPAMMSYSHVECTGCHRLQNDEGAPALPSGESHSAKVTEEACLSCHDLSYTDKLRMWRTTVDSLMTDARRAQSAAERAIARVAKTSYPEAEQARRLYDDASFNIDLAAADKSGGVHNFKYTRDLLLTARDKLQRARIIAGGDSGGDGAQ